MGLNLGELLRGGSEGGLGNTPRDPEAGLVCGRADCLYVPPRECGRLIPTLEGTGPRPRVQNSPGTGPSSGELDQPVLPQNVYLSIFFF